MVENLNKKKKKERKTKHHVEFCKYLHKQTLIPKKVTGLFDWRYFDSGNSLITLLVLFQ